MENKPTLFFDQDRWFVKYAKSQARSAGHKVVSLHNHENDIPGYQKGEIPDERISKINDLYIHLSNNPYTAEYYSLVRWFYFEKYMRDNNVTEALICDSDVLIFVAPEDIWNCYEIEENEIGLLCTKNFSGGTCLISLRNLTKFCDYILYQYKNESKRLETMCKKGDNISDMTFFKLFITESNHIKPVCLNDYSNELIIDDSTIIKHHRYQFENKLPVMDTNNNKIAALHYQGSNKYLMPFHYTKSTKLDILNDLHRILIYWANSKVNLNAKVRKTIRWIGIKHPKF